MTQQRNMSDTATTAAMSAIQAAVTQGRGRTVTMATRRGRRSAGTPIRSSTSRSRGGRTASRLQSNNSRSRSICSRLRSMGIRSTRWSMLTIFGLNYTC